MVPCNNYVPNRVCTGYEAIVPHLTTSEFIVKVDQPAKIEAIDEKNHLIKVLYKDGTTRVFEYGEVTGKSGGSAYNHELVLMEGVKVGKICKEGEILAYHKAYFKINQLTKQPIWCHGVPGRVAITLSDATLEDSSVITESFSKKFGFSPIYTSISIIDASMEIKEFKQVGDVVEYDTDLLVTGYSLDESYGEIDSIFEEFQQSRYRAGHKGVIQSVRVYSSTLDTTPSIDNFIKTVSKSVKAKARFAKGTLNGGRLDPIILVPVGSRIGKKTVPEEAIIVVYEIKSSQGLDVGDKIIFDSSLKTVVGEVTPQIYSEDGEELDAKFSGLSIFNRVVLSVYIQGIMNKIIIEAERELVKMLNE